MAGNGVKLTSMHDGEDERSFMQRVLVDSTATGAALTAEQRGYGPRQVMEQIHYLSKAATCRGGTRRAGGPATA